MAKTAATEHPRPLLRRAWQSLDGPWAFAFDRDATARTPGDVDFAHTITVPFAPETPASGIGDTTQSKRTWYRRTVGVDAPPGTSTVVHFGAVDRIATIWVDGHPVAHHEGGYTPFAVDLSAHASGPTVDLVVSADDDPLDQDAPRGKQEWLDEPHFIWYPRTSGIWRTVWTEHVPHCSIASLEWHADPGAMTVSLQARVAGPMPDGTRLDVRLRSGPRTLVDDTTLVTGPEIRRTYSVGDGGIDDTFALCWWPWFPTLHDAEVALVAADGSVLDEVETEVAIRSVNVDDGALLLNGRPQELRLVLDQGYWPDTGLTPPDSEALRRDLELTRALGFHGARKHQKVEDPRYLAWADRMGMLVWVELPSAYRPGPTSAQHLVREWSEIVTASAGHPSVIAWVPINESWGVPNVGVDPAQQALVRALAAMTDALDGTRPVSANDGWETIGGDIVGIHDYDQDPDALRTRYGTRDAVDRFLTGLRPDGRTSDIERRPAAGRAVVLSEFGGISIHDDSDATAWGYQEAKSPEDLLERYAALWAAVRDCDGLIGACWTQLTDTYQEANGLLRFDRTPKAPLEDLARATRGR